MKITGIERKQGTFSKDDKSSFDYDNTIIYFLCSSENVTGLKTAFCKVKTSMILNSLGCEIKDIPTLLINSDADIEYDFSFNPPRACSISIHNIDKKS